MTCTYEPNVFKKCKVSLKVLLHRSNICTRGLTKRDYHGIDPLLPVMFKNTLNRVFLVNGILLHANIKKYFQQQNRIISHIDSRTTLVGTLVECLLCGELYLNGSSESKYILTEKCILGVEEIRQGYLVCFPLRYQRMPP